MPTTDGQITSKDICNQAVVERILGDESVTSIKIFANLQSDNYDGGVIASDPGTAGWRIERNTGDAVFNDVTLRGDLISANWDGTDPPNLSSEDTGASAGFALDSSVGSAQFEGSLFIGGDIAFSGTLTGGTFSTVVLEGDVYADAWDGATPANLVSTFDTSATDGFYLDSSAGNAQYVGSLWARNYFIISGSSELGGLAQVGGDLQLASSVSNSIPLRLTGGTSTVYITNPIRGSDGGATVPSYSFESDPNTGMYWIASGQLGLSSNGRVLLTIGQTGAIEVLNPTSANSFALRVYDATSTTTDRVINVSSDVGGTNTTTAYVEADGDFFNTNGTYGTISDRRLKDDIQPARPYLDDLLRLKVRRYRLKGQNNPLLGFVADEFAEVFPALVTRSTNPIEGEEVYDTIKTSVLIPMLVSAIQELAARN